MSERGRNLGPLLIILTVLIAAVGADAVRSGKWPDILSAVGLGERDYVLEARAPEGQVIGGFPPELLGTVSDAELTESARYRGTEENEGYEVLTAVYTTAAPSSDLFAAYVNYMSDRGYDVTRADAKRGVTLLEAESPHGLISVEISARGLRANQVEIGVRRSVLE